MARILLADDDKGALDLVKRALETDGHKVSTFEDGNEALAALQSAQFDVLVADIEMPGMDGITLATSARSQTPGLGVIFISGSNELLDKARGGGPAGARLVTKPFSIDLIRTEVRAVLRS